jgi:hypothetical protein
MVNLAHAAAGAEDVEALVDNRFRAVAEAETTFAGKVGAILDEVVRLTEHHPSRAALLRPRRDTCLPNVVDDAIDAGLVEAADREIVIDTLVATIAGLVAVGSAAPAVQAEAVRGFKRLFRCDVMTACR